MGSGKWLCPYRQPILSKIRIRYVLVYLKSLQASPLISFFDFDRIEDMKELSDFPSLALLELNIQVAKRQSFDANSVRP